jgi:hypothetical protein
MKESASAHYFKIIEPLSDRLALLLVTRDKAGLLSNNVRSRTQRETDRSH